MPSFASHANLFLFLRFTTLYVAFALLITKLSDAVGMQLPFKASSVSFWALTIILALISAKAILKIGPHFELPSIADLFRLIPHHQGFDYLIQELTDIVQNHFPHALLLEESPVRLWSLIACKFIYKFTGDVISGSLAAAILISFMTHPDLVPSVFIVWATSVLICCCFIFEQQRRSTTLRLLCFWTFLRLLYIPYLALCLLIDQIYVSWKHDWMLSGLMFTFVFNFVSSCLISFV